MKCPLFKNCLIVSCQMPQIGLRHLVFFTFMLALGSISIAGINDDLIAYWNFDENGGSQAFDSSGNGNTGTIYGGATRIDGVMGKALDFDGVNDYIIVENSTSQQLKTNQFSISLGFKLQNDIGNTQSRLICKQEPANPQRAWGLEFFGNGYLGSQGNQLVFHDSTGSVSHNHYSGQLIQTGAWNHVSVVDSAGWVKIYLNGQLLYNTYQGLGIPSTINAPIMIGRTTYHSTAMFLFDGFMDEVRLCNRALTSSEIQELYSIPEPATISLMCLGFAGMINRKKKMFSFKQWDWIN